MAYIVTVLDRPDREHLRAANQAAHYAYLESNQHLILLRGGFPDDSGGLIGGMLVLDVPSEQAARDFIAADPYAKAGMQGELKIQRFLAAHCAPPASWK